MARSRILVALAAIPLLALSACSADGADDDAPKAQSSAPADDGSWSVDTEKCADPGAATAPIEGEVKIGSVMPLSGSVASAFAPLKTGMEAYIDWVNETNPIEGHELSLTVGDDQYNPAVTPTAVNGLLDDGVVMFAGITGTADNLAVRDILNQNCVPQIQASTGGPELNDAENYPWTSGQTAPFDVEGRIWATKIAEDFPDDPTVATFFVNASAGADTGSGFVDEAKNIGLDIVSEQTIEATQTTPPTSQLNAIAKKRPNAIFAVPLGAQCPTFLTELANVKAANAGWDPKVYLTSTCGFQSVLASAGDAADGIYSASSYLDTGNPEVVAGNEQLSHLVEVLKENDQEAGLAVAAVGWAIADIMAEAIRQAAASPDGLTQASIINAHRNLDYHAEVMREGVDAIMSGTEDDVLIQSLQILQFDAGAGVFTEVGDVITKFESS